MDLEIIQSEVVFRGRVFDVRVDQIRLEDGNETALDIVVHGGAVALIPLDEKGRIWFVRQYRHAARRKILELPAGTLEKDEDPVESAHRELREEIGMAASKLDELGRFYLAPGYSTEFMQVYLAQELTPAPLPKDEDEVLYVEKYPIDQVYTMAAQGAILDAKSLAALMLARPYLGLETR